MNGANALKTAESSASRFLTSRADKSVHSHSHYVQVLHERDAEACKRTIRLCNLETFRAIERKIGGFSSGEKSSLPLGRDETVPVSHA